MRKLLQSILTVAVLTFGYQSFAQSTLWIGYRGWDGGSNNIYGYDTTGGAYSLTTTLPLTSDATASVNGVHGMALHPATEVMYVCYQESGGSGARRLGTVDLTTGAITDIGLLGAGDITDIAFLGETLYGTGGSNTSSAKEFYEIDITDATTTNLGNLTGTSNSQSVVWDFYNDRFLRHHISSGQITEVDVTDLSETPVGSPTGWIHSLAMKNDSIVIYSDGSNIREFNLNAGTSSGILATATATIHAMAFDQFPLYLIVNGPTTFCANDSSLLSLSESGTTYQWYLDGAPIAGATDSTWYPVASGAYTCDVDGSLSTIAYITVLPAPTASFDAVPNPVDLGVDATGTIDFTNTSTGGSGGFHWDFDNGFTSSVEDPSFSFITVGTYDVTFIVTDTSNGCMDTAWVTVEVINSTGIGELSSEFNIYPTPTKDFVTVSMIDGAGIYSVSLLSLTGQEILTQQIQSATKSTKLDLSDLESGIYLVKIHNDEEEAFFKIIKQ